MMQWQKRILLYGLDLLIGSGNPSESIGKATCDRNIWNEWSKWEDVFPDHVKQTVKYGIEMTNTVVNGELR